MQFFSHLPVLAPEENLAERVPIRRQHPTGVDGDRKQPRPTQSAGRRLMIRTAVEAPNPSLRTTENRVLTRPNHHFPSRVQRAQPRENRFRMRRLVRNEFNPESPRLPVDSFVKAAAHPAAAVVINFDSLDLLRQVHGDVLSVISVLSENSEYARWILSRN